MSYKDYYEDFQLKTFFVYLIIVHRKPHKVVVFYGWSLNESFVSFLEYYQVSIKQYEDIHVVLQDVRQNRYVQTPLSLACPHLTKEFQGLLE